jgi:hypothetical protein
VTVPERWERELRKLRQAEMPAGIWTRETEGPRGERVPPVRQRILAATVAFAVFLGAGVFAWQAFRPTGGGPGGGSGEPALTDATVTFHESGLEIDPGDPSLPAAEMTADGQTEFGQTPHFDWRGATILMNTAGYVDPVRLPLGSRLIIAGDADAVAGLLADSTSRDPLEDVPLIEEHAYLMAEPGEYFLVFEATWATDTVLFYFPIEVVPVEPDLRDSDAELSIDAYPFEAVLSYGGQRISVPASSGSWTTDGEGFGLETAGDRGVPDWARILVPAGTPLELSGSWEDWRNRLEPGDGKVTSNEEGSLMFPPSPGTYDWRMTASWPEGEAEFVFGVDLVNGPTFVSPSPTEQPTPQEDVPSVVRVECVPFGPPRVDTAVVAAGPEGVLVRSPDGGNLAFEHESGIHTAWAMFDQQDASAVARQVRMPLDPGTWVVECAARSERFIGTEFEVIDPGSFFRPYQLVCPQRARLDREAFHAADFVSTEAFIRAILPGVRGDDMVERAGYRGRTDHAYPFRIVREGTIVAVIEVDVDRIVGEACAGMGIAKPLR